MENETPIPIASVLGLDAPVDGRKRRKRVFVCGLVIIIATTLIVAWNLKGTATTLQYKTEPVTRGNMVVTVTATGNLAATNQVDVGSELSGIIKTVAVDYNDVVTAGQPIARLDSAKYAAAVGKSKAEVASAKAGYLEAVATRDEKEKTLARYRKTRELTNGKMPSLEDLEKAEADLDRARAAIISASAAIDKATASLKADETDLEKTVLYSPINGIVLSRAVEPGQTVAASLQSPVLFTLAEDLRQMELQVDVDEADVGQVKEGQTAVFTVDAYPEQTFNARITQVRYGAETTDGVVTYKAVLKVENPDLILRPGMTATAEITVLRIDDALLVPNTALRFTPQPNEKKKRSRGVIGSLMPGPPRGGTSKKAVEPSGRNQPHVWVLKDNLPSPVAVSRGATDGIRTVITSGDLQPGMGVVVSAVSSNG
ncbi:MAG: efflux RND transporter periplasmic adaptor subunit [Deltaproteobacteria bacterium]|nr:efflux RND transporter periplasmic adaptor subunit [Deltaproteobacteria bacterium]